MTTSIQQKREHSAEGRATVTTYEILVSTAGDADIIGLSEEVTSLLRDSGLTAGSATVFLPGATGAITTLEFEPGVVADFQRLFDELAAADRDYRHNLLLGDGNGHSHIRAGLLGPSLVVPFAEARLLLGTWQEICLVCVDNRARERRLVVQFSGVSA